MVSMRTTFASQPKYSSISSTQNGGLLTSSSAGSMGITVSPKYLLSTSIGWELSVSSYCTVPTYQVSRCTPCPNELNRNVRGSLNVFSRPRCEADRRRHGRFPRGAVCYFRPVIITLSTSGDHHQQAHHRPCRRLGL